MLFNKQNTLEVMTYFQNLSLIEPGGAERVIAVDGAYLASWRTLTGRLDELADVTGCARKPMEQLIRALYSAKLVSEYLEILTSPELSYEKTPEGTVDLLASLFDSFRRIVGGAWSVFFPRSEFSLLADASAHFWVSCLYSGKPEELAPTVSGYFRRDQKERFQALNRPPSAARSLHVKDAVSEYLDNSREKVNKLHEAVAQSVREGLDHSFGEITRVVAKLGARGALTLDEDRVIRSPAPAVATLDTTGAGDSFDAGFLHAWVRGEPVLSCLRLGGACGALSTLGLGGTARQPSLEEALAFLAGSSG